MFISLTVTVLFCGAPSLTSGRVCLLYMLLAFTSAVFLGSESLGTRDHILLFKIWGFPFHPLLRLAGSRWRYSTPPPHWFRREQKQVTLLVLYSHGAVPRAPIWGSRDYGLPVCSCYHFSLCPRRDLNSGAPEYEAGVLSTILRCSLLGIVNVSYPMKEIKNAHKIFSPKISGKFAWMWG
jgi:hypothetical protein